MKNSFFLLCFLSLAFSSFAQEELDIFEKPIPNGVELYAINLGPVPLSLEIGFNRLKNLKCDVKIPHMVVIPVGKTETRLLGLTIIDRSKSPEYDFRFNYIPGDVNAQHQDDYVYWLPFKPGTSHVLHQGYHGNYSHKNTYALDFSMPVGTGIYASRGGIVTDIKENSNVGCGNPSCKGKSNYLVINHEDGTFSNYVHLKHDGVKVKVGDQITKGQLIGESGNTGWSSGPHLHFEVYSRGIQKNTSIPTVFLDERGKSIRLQEGQSYKSVHSK